MEELTINFTDIENIPLRTEQTVKSFGNTLIVAPHPDDESLGCGGVIALLKKYGLSVSILVLSDGTQSHPNSKKFPPNKLRKLRESECSNAAAILGLDPKHDVTFCRFPDTQVPGEESEKYKSAVARLKLFLASKNAQTIFVPWRRDPHPDHRATYQLIIKAKDQNHRIVEYPIWLYTTEEKFDAPLKSEVSAFRLDVSSVLKIKRQAISAHCSQITDLIDDDPNGFRLGSDVLNEFDLPFEVFFEKV